MFSQTDIEWITNVIVLSENNCLLSSNEIQVSTTETIQSRQYFAKKESLTMDACCAAVGQQNQ